MGFGVLGFGAKFRWSCLRVQDYFFRRYRLWFKLSGLRLRLSGVGFRVQGPGFGVYAVAFEV